MARFTRHVSPAMLVAVVALIAALGGTSYAAIKITAKDLKTGSVTSRAVKNGNLRGKDIRANGLGGGRIKESTLAKVPSAVTADSANSATTAGSAQTAGSVGGIRSAKVDFRGPSDTPERVVLSNFGGLTLSAACVANQLQVTATSSNPQATISAVGVKTQFGPTTGGDGLNQFSVPFDVDEAIGDGDADTTTGQIVYATPQGGVVTVALNMDEGTNAATIPCRLSGIAHAG